MSKPSEEFWDAIIDSGSPVADCQCCGRVHYDFNGEFMDDGELEKLEAKRKTNPEKYIPRDGTIHWGMLDEKQVVYGCQCDRVERLESFIWRHRGIIAKYLKARTQKEFARAEREKIIVGEL